MLPDISQRAESMEIAELWLPAALLSYVAYFISILAIHQHKGPAQWGTIFWQMLILKR
jgi:hypothetical protein